MDHTGAPTTRPGHRRRIPPTRAVRTGPSGPPAYGTPPVPAGHPPYGYGPPGYPPPVLPGAPPPLPPGTPPPWGPPQPTGPGWQLVLLVIGGRADRDLDRRRHRAAAARRLVGADVADSTGSPVTGVLWFVLAWLTAALIAAAGRVDLAAGPAGEAPPGGGRPDGPGLDAGRRWPPASSGTPRAVPRRTTSYCSLLDRGGGRWGWPLSTGARAGAGRGVASVGRAGASRPGWLRCCPGSGRARWAALTETVSRVLAAAAVGLAGRRAAGRPRSSPRSRRRGRAAGAASAVWWPGWRWCCSGAGVGGPGLKLAELLVLPRARLRGRRRWPPRPRRRGWPAPVALRWSASPRSARWPSSTRRRPR